MKKLIIVLFILAFTGCAKFWDSREANGGIFMSSKAPYIIVNQSGGKIMDVYKLTNAMVQSPSGSDGWLFLDQEGNPVYLGGDVKTIRLKQAGGVIWNAYHEYHREFEVSPYSDLYPK
jgi:hypothetical protein